MVKIEAMHSKQRRNSLARQSIDIRRHFDEIKRRIKDVDCTSTWRTKELEARLEEIKLKSRDVDHYALVLEYRSEVNII